MVPSKNNKMREISSSKRSLGALARFGILLLFLTFSPVICSWAGTLATFETSVGTMELEFFDEDKPVTASNFIKYVTSGRFTNEFIQRWEPNFVIQAGGYRVTNTVNGPKIETIPTFNQITNEYSVGRTYSNTYGTIAMARQSGGTNSATSQWFLNLKDNSFLDSVDGGFTVFGRVTSGTNILNRFIPRPPTQGIYSVNVDGGALTTVPALNAVTNIDQLFTNLIYIDVQLRRDLDLEVRSTRPGQHVVSWTTVAGVTNSLEYSSALTSGSWTEITNIVGNGATFNLVNSAAAGESKRVYRVKVVY